jgi:hypothetical protein
MVDRPFAGVWPAYQLAAVDIRIRRRCQDIRLQAAWNDSRRDRRQTEGQ